MPVMTGFMGFFAISFCQGGRCLIPSKGFFSRETKIFPPATIKVFMLSRLLMPRPLAILALSISWTSTSRAGEGPNDHTRLPTVSDDGRFIAFQTNATNLLDYGDGDDDTFPNVFWMDRETRIIHNAQLVGGPTAEEFFGAASNPSISRDGEWVVFQSSNTFIPGNDGYVNIFVSAVRSVADGIAAPTKFKMISRAPNGDAGNGNSRLPCISGDGRFIVYKSNATNLTGDVVSGGTDRHYFRHDRDFDENGIFDEDEPGATQTVLMGGPTFLADSADNYWPTLSSDGTRALLFTTSGLPKFWNNGGIFETNSTIAQGGLTPNGAIVLSTTRVYSPPSPAASGTGTYYRYRSDGDFFGFPDSGEGAVANNGATLILTSTKADLVGADDNGNFRDVYLINRTSGVTSLISSGVGGPANGQSAFSAFPDPNLHMSSDGRYIVFSTNATNMGFEDNNGSANDVIFVDRVEGIRDRVEASGGSNSDPGLNVEGGPPFTTSEAGGSTDIALSLQTEPTRVVTVKVSGWNEAEGRVSATRFVFTPANWDQPQVLRITGVDDWVDDGDHTHGLQLKTVSRDPDYSNLSEQIEVVNQDDDDPATGSEIRVGQEVDLPLDAFGNVLAVVGIPAGVRWDRNANALVGAPRAARAFPMRVTIRQTDGKRATFRVPVTISPLPDHAVGTFSGNVARETEVNQGLGGMTQYRVSRNGASSGFVRMGAMRYPWRGRVTVPAVGDPSIDVSVNRRGMDPLNFQTDLAGDSQVAGQYQIEGTLDAADVTGWQHTWNRRSRVPGKWAGVFNTHLTLGTPPSGSPWIGDETIPQGTGYARVIVTPTGLVRWISQLADGTRVRGAGHLGPQGGVHHWQPLYRNTGTVMFAGDLNDSDELDGVGDWVKRAPQPPRARSYADGFGEDPRGPVGLILTGGRWERPPRGENLLTALGLAETADNLAVAFTAGGIGDSATDPDGFATLDARNRLAVSDPNPARVIVRLNRNTGMLTGILRPVDDNPERPGRNLVRTTRIVGIWVPRLDRAEGAFQLPQLANPGVTTARNSPMLSGKVSLQPSP